MKTESKNKQGKLKKVSRKKVTKKESKDDESLTNDPTQPDTEISHTKKHYIGDKVKKVNRKLK